MSDLVRAVHEAAACSGPYERAQAYYDGTVEEIHANRAIRRFLCDSSSGFKLNYARRVVDAVLDRLKLVTPQVPNDETATALLTDVVWNANHLGRRVKIVHRSALVNGDGYLLVWPGQEPGTVSLWEQSAEQMRVFYDDEYPDRKAFAAKVWMYCPDPTDRDQDRVRVTLYYPDRIERWVAKRGGAAEVDTDFEPYVEDGESWPQVNPFGEVPVFHFRTDEPYGRPEHRDAYGPQNSINKLVAGHMSGVDFQSFPQRYVLRNVGETSDPSALDQDDVNAPGSTSTTTDSNLVASPGSVWDLFGVDEVGQLDAAKPETYMVPMAVYIRSMSALTNTPLHHFDPVGQVPSGEALRAAEAPLVAKIKDRQTWFGEEWRNVMKFAMAAAGHPVSEVRVEWEPPQVTNDKESWDGAAAKMATGVPAEVIWAEAGYLPEQYQSWTAPQPAETAKPDPAPTDVEPVPEQDGEPDG